MAKNIGRNKGFTLIELLTVIAILAVLSGISFGLISGVQRQQNEARANSEMQAIALGLESFKRAYNDFPWLGQATDGTELFKALSGKSRLRVSSGKISMDDISSTDGKPLLELDTLTLNEDGTALVDPWGNAYHYYYRSPGSGTQYADTNYQNWPFKRRSFVLLSAGPDGAIDDGASTNHANGKLPSDPAEYFDIEANKDNIVFGYEY